MDNKKEAEKRRDRLLNLAIVVVLSLAFILFLTLLTYGCASTSASAQTKVTVHEPIKGSLWCGEKIFDATEVTRDEWQIVDQGYLVNKLFTIFLKNTDESSPIKYCQVVVHPQEGALICFLYVCGQGHLHFIWCIDSSTGKQVEWYEACNIPEDTFQSIKENFEEAFDIKLGRSI